MIILDLVLAIVGLLMYALAQGKAGTKLDRRVTESGK
jgi:hypothetical protein